MRILAYRRRVFLVKLKQAGVADSTIELLIKRSGDARAAGV